MFADVRALVIATAVKVAPKEGDTPDRAKYRQVHSTAHSARQSYSRICFTWTRRLFSSTSQPLVCF